MSKYNILKTKFCPNCGSNLERKRVRDIFGKGYHREYYCTKCTYHTYSLDWYNKKGALKDLENILISSTRYHYWTCEDCGHYHEYDWPNEVEQYTIIACEKCGKKVFIGCVAD